MLKKYMQKMNWALLVMGFVAYPTCQAEGADDFWAGFHFGGYTSVGLEVPRSSSAQLSLNELSLILTWDNETRTKFFGEFELEEPLYWNESQGFTSKDAHVDLERFYVDYNLSEKINGRVGRFLSPAGRWNLLHAPPLVWTSSRPMVTKALYPTAINGLMLFGNMPLNNSSLEYNVYTELLKDQVKDDGETIYKHVNGGRVVWNNVFGLAGNNAGLNYLGLNLLMYKKDNDLSPHYRLIGLDFVTEFKRLELSGEAYHRWTNHRSNAGSGAYLQSAYALGHDWYWLTRLETFQSPETGNADRWLIGATKRVKPNQLLKLEWVGGSGDVAESPRGFLASFAVLF